MANTYHEQRVTCCVTRKAHYHCLDGSSGDGTLLIPPKEKKDHYPIIWSNWALVYVTQGCLPKAGFEKIALNILKMGLISKPQNYKTSRFPVVFAYAKYLVEHFKIV